MAPDRPWDFQARRRQSAVPWCLERSAVADVVEPGSASPRSLEARLTDDKFYCGSDPARHNLAVTIDVINVFLTFFNVFERF